MKTIALTVLMGAVAVASAADKEWLSREFTDNWDVPGKSAEEFLNSECQPSGLDGIQMYAIQPGHDQAYHLHISCRHDASRTAHYKVTMVEAPKGKIGGAVQPLMSNPKVRIGPFFFGKTANVAEPKDGMLVVEKTK